MNEIRDQIKLDISPDRKALYIEHRLSKAKYVTSTKYLVMMLKKRIPYLFCERKRKKGG